MHVPRSLLLAFVLCCAPLAACGDDDGGGTDSGARDSGGDAIVVDQGPRDMGSLPDSAEPDAPPPADLGPADGAPPADGAMPDGEPPADLGPVDSGPPPMGCDQVTEDLRLTRESASYCERSTECAARLSPTCPEGACHVYFTTGYYLDDMIALEDEYNALDCGAGTACRCMAPPDTFACIDNTCGPCPATPASCPYTCALDCPCFVDACGCDQPFCAAETCEELGVRLQDAAYDSSGCTVDADCAVSPSPICPELGCYVAHHVGASLEQLRALVGAYVARGCSTAVCDCAPPPSTVICNAGTCEGVFP